MPSSAADPGKSKGKPAKGSAAAKPKPKGAAHKRPRAQSGGTGAFELVIPLALTGALAAAKATLGSRRPSSSQPSSSKAASARRRAAMGGGGAGGLPEAAHALALAPASGAHGGQAGGASVGAYAMPVPDEQPALQSGGAAQAALAKQFASIAAGISKFLSAAPAPSSSSSSSSARGRAAAAKRR